MLYPWNATFFSQFKQQSIPQALLFFGEQAIGKFNFSMHLANYLVCEGTHDKPCQQCQACHWFSQANHPDFFPVLPENQSYLLEKHLQLEIDLDKKEVSDKKLSKFIKIEQIRDVVSSNILGSYRGGKRIIFIYPVESMATEAANCLLKSLEEPSPNVIYILVTHRIDLVLPTIRSRCVAIPVPKPKEVDSLEWLRLQDSCKRIDRDDLGALLTEHGKSPLKTLQAVEGGAFNGQVVIEQLSRFGDIEISQVIDLLAKNSLIDILNCLYRWCIDIYLSKSNLPVRYYPRWADKIKLYQDRMSFSQLSQFIKFLMIEMKLASHPLFPKLQLESLLAKYARLFKA